MFNNELLGSQKGLQQTVVSTEKANTSGLSGLAFDRWPWTMLSDVVICYQVTGSFFIILHHPDI